MFKVFISRGNFHIDRQIPLSANMCWGDCKFIFDCNQDYDYFITLDGISEPLECKVDKKHRLLFLGEPPYVKHYNKDFIRQYGHVYSCQRKIINNEETNVLFPLLPWMIGISFRENSHIAIKDKPYLCYDDFKKMSEVSRISNKACLITSNKRFTKGHRDRVNFANYVMSHHSDLIDVYGNGYVPIPDKIEVLKKYKYAIIIENCKYPDYWTEKIGDCFLAGCFPIYHGCPNISDYFSHNSYSEINICNIKESVNKIREIIESNKYDIFYDDIQKSKNLVMDEYNIFNQIDKKIKEIEEKEIKKQYDPVPEVLYPMKFTFLDKINQIFAWKFNIVI